MCGHTFSQSISLPFAFLSFPGPLLNGNRRVYFHALASVKEGWTLASVLLNQTLLENSLTPTNLFKMSDYGRNSQSTSEVMSDEGVLFFPLLKSNSLACWNSKTVYKQDNIVTLYTVRHFRCEKY